MSRHGRACIPFGRYKGCRIRLLPDSYLSFLTTLPMLKQENWHWLWESLIAELKFRGLKYDLAGTDDPVVEENFVPHGRKFRVVVEPDQAGLDFS